MEVILGKYGELALKGLNKNSFESVLFKTIKKRIARFGHFRISAAQSTVYIEPQDESCNIDAAFDEVRTVFGLSAVGKAVLCEKSLVAISNTAVDYLGQELEQASTFKVKSKRSDKKFPMTSMELSAEVGAYILDHYPQSQVTELSYSLFY